MTIKKLLGFTVVQILIYFVTLFLMFNSGQGGAAFAVMLFVFPVLVLLLNVLFSWRFGFTVVAPIITGLSFLPFVYLMLNSSALVYCLVYGVIGLIGAAIGVGITRIANSFRK